uniref:Putative secreted protein n=1 Tax=Anopheles darlingi TaxID=43151 RepID=A0A2M4DDQ8_ANODA
MKHSLLMPGVAMCATAAVVVVVAAAGAADVAGDAAVAVATLEYRWARGTDFLPWPATHRHWLRSAPHRY